MPESFEKLERIYARLSAWTSMAEFSTLLDDYFRGVRSEKEIELYREKRGPLKALRDEVVPVLHHLQFREFDGDVRFAFDNHTPDCWLRSGADTALRGVEVTVALAREGVLRGKELNEKKIGRGFIGIQDDTPSRQVEERMAARRSMYTSDQAKAAIKTAIATSLERKNDPRYLGLDLLVEAPLSAIPSDRWEPVMQELEVAANELPFREVHLISDKDGRMFGYQLK